HDVLGAEPAPVVRLVPGFRETRKALALAVGLRVQAILERDADVASPIPYEPRRLGPQATLEIALPEIVGLEQVTVAVDDRVTLHGWVLPGVSPRAPALRSSSRIRWSTWSLIDTKAGAVTMSKVRGFGKGTAISSRMRPGRRVMT